MYIIGNGRLLTRDTALPFLENGAVLVDAEYIKDVGYTNDLRSRYPDADFIDASGGIIMPGLIDAHAHIYTTLARGLSMPGYNPTCFYEVLSQFWWKLDRQLTLDACIMSAYAAVIECIKNGVTTIFDHHASFFNPLGTLMAIGSVTSELGIRACLCYATSERDGGFKCTDSITENIDFINFCCNSNFKNVKAMFGLHAPFTLSAYTIQECVELNNGLTGFHIHVSQSLDDVYDSIHKYGKRPIELLHDLGVLGNKTILAGCVHITEKEMDIIKATGSSVVNTPISNMNYGVGCVPVLELFKKGITVGLGTDSLSNDIIESAKAAFAIQRHSTGLPDITGETMSMLIENNREIASKYFDDSIGIIKKGAVADIIIMDYKPFTIFDESTADKHILSGMSGKNCCFTMVGGKILMKDKKLQMIDEDSIYQSIREASTALWKSL